MQREGLLKKSAHRSQSGHDEKRYLPPSQRRERPFVSFALIANQASNIFFGPFKQSPKLFLTIKKEAAEDAAPQWVCIIDDLAGNLFARIIRS